MNQFDPNDCDAQHAYLERKRRQTLTIIVAVVVVVGFYAVNIWIGWGVFKDRDDRGTAGDTFGMVNALFSGLALGAIVVTIFQQNIDLQFQMSQLVETRKAYQEQLLVNQKQLLLNAYIEMMHGSREILAMAVQNPEVAKQIIFPADSWNPRQAYFQMWLNRYCVGWLARVFGGDLEIKGLKEAEWEDIVGFTLANNGFKEHWKNVKQVFPDDFRKYMDDAVTEANTRESRLNGGNSAGDAQGI